jgi:hypothetical protein
MTTTAVSDSPTRARHIFRRHERERVERKVRTWSVSLGFVGVIAVLISAWGALVPYLGPAMGFGGDGSASWHWNLSHALISLIPGGVGIIVGLSLLAPRGASVGRSRFGLTWAGLFAIASGAWFMVGPLAWPVLNNTRAYFVSATPLRELEYWIGYALGPGLIVAMCGAFALGWAARHDRPLGAVGAGVEDRVTSEVTASEQTSTAADQSKVA